MKAEEFTNEPYFCLFAPDGTWQPLTLADDYATCLAMLRLMEQNGIGQPYSELLKKGFEILPLNVSIKVTGDAEAAFQAGKAAIA